MLNSFFGTDGIRKTVGQSPITHQELQQLGYALGSWACSHHTNPRIIVAQDPRESSAWITTNLYGGMLSHNVTIACARVLPSPAVAYLLEYSSQFDYGIIISASHNQYHDNGIKLLSKNGMKLSSDDEQDIMRHFYQPTQTDYTTFGTVYTFLEGYDLYVNAITSYFPENFLHGKKIVLDCANGALYKIAPVVFEACGAKVIAIHNQPTGRNINQECGATDPRSLVDAVREHNATMGFAFDGDGDRVIAVTQDGRICDGDDILALLSTHENYQKENTIVGTVMSNHNFTNFLQQQNKKLIRTDVGDKYVAKTLAEQNLSLGGEPSGHIIIRDYLPTGDGLYVALRIMQTILQTNNYQFTTFEKFPHVLVNIPVKNKKDLSSEPFAGIIKQSESHIKNGRLFVRYSGTESRLRILVEDDNKEHAQTIATSLAQQLSEQLT